MTRRLYRTSALTKPLPSAKPELRASFLTSSVTSIQPNGMLRVKARLFNWWRSFKWFVIGPPERRTAYGRLPPAGMGFGGDSEGNEPPDIEPNWGSDWGSDAS